MPLFVADHPPLWLPPKPAILRRAPDLVKPPYILAGFVLPGIGGGMLAGLGQYRANAVHFDGTWDYLTRGADLTGNADSKLLTFSIWIRMQGGDGSARYFITNATTVGGTTHRLLIARTTNNRILVEGRNTSGTDVLYIESSTDSMQIADGWVSVLCSVDLSNTAKRHLYLNDVSDLTVTTYTNETMDLAVGDYSVGARTNGAGLIDADLADLWFMPGLYIDFSVEANRRKFINAAKKPVYLGADGSLPTGTAPLLFLSDATAAWHTNKGSGGGLTVMPFGALTTAATSPSD